MRFFEFNEFSYYALIGAITQEDAMQCYKEEISDLDEDGGEPDELTEEETREKLLSVCEKSVSRSPDASKSGMKSVIEEEKAEAISEFEQDLKHRQPFIVLIDNELI